MTAIPKLEVDTAIAALEQAKGSLPEQGNFKSKTETLRAVVGILNEVWNTEGGQKEQAQLSSLVDNLDCSGLEGSIATVKIAKVTASSHEVHAPYNG